MLGDEDLEQVIFAPARLVALTPTRLTVCKASKIGWTPSPRLKSVLPSARERKARPLSEVYGIGTW